MMNEDTLDKLTRAFLNCNDLDDEDIEEALRGFGVEIDETHPHADDESGRVSEIGANG